MGLGQNVMIFSLILSIFLFLGGVRVLPNNNHDKDMLGGFININNDNTTSIYGGISDSLPQKPQSTSIQSGSGITGTSFGIVDGLNLVYDFIANIFNFLAAELILFSVAGMPTAFIFLIAIPLVFIKILAVITFIRGIIW